MTVQVGIAHDSPPFENESTTTCYPLKTPKHLF
jgi:hypothetical protein